MLCSKLIAEAYHWWRNDRNITQYNEIGSSFTVFPVRNVNMKPDFNKNHYLNFRTADSQLNNFTRIEPTLHLLSIPFDTNVARDIMTEKHGVATRLMYQLYIALNNKKKSNLTGVAIETMKPAAPAKLNAVESGIYKEVSLFVI